MRKIILALAIVASTLSGCARVETGAVGIVKHWGGEVDRTPVTGFNWVVFDSIIAEIDTTETRLPIDGLRPSDSNGVMLDALDVVVSFQMDPTKVADFYIRTKELDKYKDDAGREVETVGLQVLKNMVQHTIQEETKKEALVTLAGNLGGYEARILERAQKELDVAYPGIFKLIRINVNHFTPPKAILDQANTIAGLKVEAARIDQEQTLIAKRTALEQAKAKVEAEALKAAMDATHISAADLIAWRNARAYEMQAKAIADQATKVIDPTHQPAAK